MIEKDHQKPEVRKVRETLVGLQREAERSREELNERKKGAGGRNSYLLATTNSSPPSMCPKTTCGIDHL